MYRDGAVDSTTPISWKLDLLARYISIIKRGCMIGLEPFLWDTTTVDVGEKIQ